MPSPFEDKSKKVFKMIGNAPIWHMLNNLAQGIADAQQAVDAYVFETITAMAVPENHITIGTESKSLLELGMVPSFYHFQEVNISIKMALSSTEEAGFTIGASIGVTYKIVGATLSAEYSNKYSFSADAASEVNTKIVSIPAPVELKEVIQQSIANSKT